MTRNDSYGRACIGLWHENAFYLSPLPSIRPGISGASGAVGGVQP
ncbi:MAG: hypothetical protein PUK67_05195 [Prevotellaceae bacterium]|nr:hypothetical protein [Prevotellaceae bacterium]MDY3365802.1 hypothetical protein [Prevotella sp.]